MNEINDLLNPEKGYILRRRFLTIDAADRYRNECQRFLQTTNAIYKKIHRYCKHDYVWAEDGRVLPGVFSYRIYQSLHAKHSVETEDIFRTMISLRNKIEANWLHDDRYRKSRKGLYDYVQVTSYGTPSDGIARHRDYYGKAPYPLLQCLIVLSEPGEDYRGGDLILHTKSGISINIQATLNLQKGDALLFDKSLDHEVQPIFPSASSRIGRWTVNIGARYPSPALTARAWRLIHVVGSQAKARLIGFRPATH
jgi:hypothetical protein